MRQRRDTTKTSVVKIGAGAIALFTMIACAAPVSYEGTPYGGGKATRGRDVQDLDEAGDAKSKGQKTNAPSPMRETPEPAESSSGARPSSTTPPTAPATPAPTATPVPAPAPAPTTPPPTTPSCQSANPDACFDCCLRANPGATSVESAYDACLNNTLDDFGVAQCQSQHASQCNASSACRQHHACLSANGCFDPLS